MAQAIMTQGQTEGLISGAIRGYEGFVNLTGEEKYSEQAGNDLFEGMSEIQRGVRNTGDLKSLLETMAGITLKSEFKRKIHAASGFTTDVNNVAGSVLGRYEDKVRFFQEEIEAEVAQKRQIVKNFEEALGKLRISYETGNVLEVAEALEAISGTANWGSKVPVGMIYGAVGEMEKLARFDFSENIEGAGDLRIDLADVLEGAKVRNVWIGTPEEPVLRGPFRHEPAVDMIYRGKIDHELMAREILRTF
ncbi:hypothetical protein HOD53_02490 [Candidatus Woesearchaeota archaeon]|jgi:hypothetical protein|nr:hypothetical protein [Candidatus Woesearchaeota archaeon]